MPSTADYREWGVSVAWVEDPEGTRAHPALTALVADAYDVPVAAVRLTHLCPRCGSDGHGRPLVLVEDRPGAHVSLARAGGWSLVAVGPPVPMIEPVEAVRPVRVDVEAVRPIGVDVEHVAGTRFEGFDAVALHPAEHAADAGERAVLWVRKEALLKAAGTGLATDPREVRVTAAGEPAAVLDWPHGPARLADLEAPAGLVAALALSR